MSFKKRCMLSAGCRSIQHIESAGNLQQQGLTTSKAGTFIASFGCRWHDIIDLLCLQLSLTMKMKKKKDNDHVLGNLQSAQPHHWKPEWALIDKNTEWLRCQPGGGYVDERQVLKKKWPLVLLWLIHLIHRMPNEGICKGVFGRPSLCKNSTC